MPNIDTSSISGYAEMTAEQKVAALESLDIPESVDMTQYVLKSVFDAKASETAALSKRLKEILPAEQAAEEARKQAEEEFKQKIADLEKSNADLVKKQTVAEYKAQYIAQGMDASMAEDTAKALADGDMTKVFANRAKHIEALEAKIKADLMNKTPSPDGAGGNDGRKDSAVEKAKEIAKAKSGGGKSYADVMSKYKK